MKIGIVAPSPVPFCIGGAENVYWGLLNQINRHTPHQAELVKLPTPETGFRDLVAGYRRFFHLNLDHFDRVISAKYPAWMVSHPYHVCYMLHRLRGLYDTYHFTGLPEACRTRHDRVVDCLSFIRSTSPSSGSVPLLFDCLETLMDDPSVPADTFALPGPFALQVVHFLDAAGLAPEKIRKYTAISRTVADRKDYFPPDARVEVIYPPSNLPRFECGEQDHLFTVSRLDGPKRIQLLIEAMAHVKSDIVLNIAGTGPDELRLKEMAAHDHRIRFLGFVRDDEIVELYAHALAVPYVPLNEDYGLVTIEAMMSGKPVLTVTDSGGPTEFVTNGETGFCVPPAPEALAARIDQMCRNRRACREMGETARKRVVGITWENTVSRLLEETPDTNQKPNRHIPHTSPGNPGDHGRSRTGRGRRKLTVAATFPVYPPLGGGQSRVFHLYRHLAKWWDIDLVTFTGAAEPGLNREIAPGMTEIRIPKTGAHESAEQKLSRALNWIPVTDAAMPRLCYLTPAYQQAVERSAERADALVASHPFLVEVLSACGSGRPLWFEAHNVEIDLKSDILGTCPTARKLLDDVRAAESRCWQTASVVYACSRTDLDRLESLYGPANALLLEVPNGVCTREVPFTSLDDRRALKRKLGFENIRIAVFTGSWHGPNLVAVKHLIAMAECLPEMNFLVLGSSGNAFDTRALPPNMAMAGVVSEQEKNMILSMADAALNPMTTGSGTNLKMLEYFAAGVPVISTPFGARGLTCRPGSELHTADIASFPRAITAFFTHPDKSVQQMVLQARHLAEDTYDWAVIARNMHDRLLDRM